MDQELEWTSMPTYDELTLKELLALLATGQSVYNEQGVEYFIEVSSSKERSSYSWKKRLIAKNILQFEKTKVCANEFFSKVYYRKSTARIPTERELLELIGPDKVNGCSTLACLSLGERVMDGDTCFWLDEESKKILVADGENPIKESTMNMKHLLNGIFIREAKVDIQPRRRGDGES